MDTRKEFEQWYEDDAMPLESYWFRRDAKSPDEYDLIQVQTAWEMWQRMESRQTQTINEQAAMIERLKDALGKAVGWNWLADDDYLSDEMAYCLQVHDETPAQSLTLLTAHDNAVRVEVEKETIDRCSGYICGCGLTNHYNWLNENMARKYKGKGDG